MNENFPVNLFSPEKIEMTNSRAKGAEGEREWAKFLQSRGLMARRGQQFSGGPGSPDVLCQDLPGIHFEVKRVELLSLYKAMNQAVRDAGEHRTPVVAHRRSRKGWLVVMRAEDWIEWAMASEIGDFLDTSLEEMLS